MVQRGVSPNRLFSIFAIVLLTYINAIAGDKIDLSLENAVTNLQEYKKRELSMSKNMQEAGEIINLSITQFCNGEISVQDLLQNINRQKETEENFLKAYLGYSKSLLGLTVDTFYDYKNNIKLLDKFRANG